MQSIKNGFYYSDAQLEPPQLKGIVSTDIQQTLTRLLGWNATQERFLIVNVDNDGRLLVSTNTTKTDTGTISRISLSGSDELALPSNDLRRAFRLLNRGATTIKVAFVTPIVSSYFTLDANGTYYDDIYSGNIYVNGTALNILEVVEL